MRQLVYALRFTGQATPASPDGSVLTVAGTAPSATLVAAVVPGDPAGALQPAAGEAATVASEMTFTGDTSFQEVGAIDFGGGHLLRFATVGSGYLGPGPDRTHRHGAGAARIVGGDGRFAGAGGLITSNFVLADDLGITDHRVGVLYMP